MENNKITLQEHEIIGMIGKVLNDKLVSREVEISNNAKNKVEGRKLSNHWNKANKSLSEFRNNMEEIMFKEFPEERETAGFEDIYYGGKDRTKMGEINIIEWIKKYLSTIEKLKEHSSKKDGES